MNGCSDRIRNSHIDQIWPSGSKHKHLSCYHALRGDEHVCEERTQDMEYVRNWIEIRRLELRIRPLESLDEFKENSDTPPDSPHNHPKNPKSIHLGKAGFLFYVQQGL